MKPESPTVDTSAAINVLKAITALSESTLSDSINNTGKQLQKLIDTTTKQINSLQENRPILEVQVNGSKNKLSSLAVPYLDTLILYSKLGMNSLLVGPAGCGKTTAAKQLAEALNLEFYSVCLTAGASETWLFGRHTPSGFIEGPFSLAYKNGGIFLADEMDAADANLLLSINTALENNLLFNPMSGELIKKHADFICLGCANTFGKGADHVYTGRSRLDGATLDRFKVVTVGYDVRIEKLLCDEPFIQAWLWESRLELSKQGFSEIISTRIFDYVSKCVAHSFPIELIFDCITASWTDDARKVMLKAYESTKKIVPDMPEHLRTTNLEKKPSNFQIKPFVKKASAPSKSKSEEHAVLGSTPTPAKTEDAFADFYAAKKAGL